MRYLKMKNLYIIAGCNGAGKTTASYTVLPDILNCQEFVNADEIARGLSPFQPEKVSIQAARLMLARVKNLLEAKEDFAIETTLATKIYVNLIKRAQQKGYQVALLFFWLNSPDLAVKRVYNRVREGGHNIPEEVIRRRYESGLQHFFTLYQPIANSWVFVDNSGQSYQIVAKGKRHISSIVDKETWRIIQNSYDE